jgi:hypothetical protein
MNWNRHLFSKNQICARSGKDDAENGGLSKKNIV